MDTDEEYDDDNYNNDIYIDTENLPVMRLLTPFNVEACGMYGRSFAYYSLKERLPVILTKIIDYLSREKSKIVSSNPGASEADVVKFVQEVAKLKSDLVTNKEYDRLRIEGPEAEKWNKWIESQDNKKYFLNSWMFSECYVYRRLYEGCELTKTLKNFDYFEEQKNKAFQNNVEIMCLVADKMMTMINISEKDKRKADFVTLLKICLWANRCDLSLSLGSQVDLIQSAKDATEKLRLNPPPPPPTKGKKGKKAATPSGPVIISADPFQMILDLKDKTIVDDSNKIADQVVAKSQVMMGKVTTAHQSVNNKLQCSCNRLAKAAGLPICVDKTKLETVPETTKEGAPDSAKDTKPPTTDSNKDTKPPTPDSAKDTKPPTADSTKDTKPPSPDPAKDTKPAEPEAPKIPCPAKMTVPRAVMFDIVCDNAGYELFADLCLAHFLVAQQLVQKVRFHVKNMPWFISDVTPKDFKYLIDACCNSQFSQPSSTGAMEAEGGGPKVINAENLRALGQQWKKFVEDGVFIVLDEEFWTYPHCYKEMKKIDPNLYRKLQLAVAIMFKGDLNYRKLMGDINCNPYLGFQASLQGFIPAPIIAVRTVKAETICGLPKGRWDALNQHDPKWMQSGDYGVIQWCPKGETLKVSDRPCIDYCTKCFGVICPEREDM